MAGKEISTTSSPHTPSIVSAYDWGVLGHVVDVGGDGSLLIALLNEYPALRGTVAGPPAAAETARKLLAAAGLSGRANAVAADPRHVLPEGAEGYVLSAVLRDWNDDDACVILRNCATAAGEDGAVFVIEVVAPADGEAGGRGVAELSALAERAGLVVAAVHTAGTAEIVELRAR